MSLTVVTARARTRGKSPVEFPFQAVGRLRPRKVMDKDGNPILVNDKNEAVKYTDKDGKVLSAGVTRNESGDLVAPEGHRFIEVDDVETAGLTDNFQEVLDLFGSLTDAERNNRTPLQMVIDNALDGFNYTSRKNAAPVTEQVTEDELTPITVGLVEHKILSEQDATTWRRTITGAAKTMEVDRLTFAKQSPQYKKLIAAGWKEAA